MLFCILQKKKKDLSSHTISAPAFSGDLVSPTSKVRASAMLLLLRRLCWSASAYLSHQISRRSVKYLRGWKNGYSEYGDDISLLVFLKKGK